MYGPSQWKEFQTTEMVTFIGAFATLKPQSGANRWGTTQWFPARAATKWR